MIDGCGRQIDHLRLSLTDHCNLACRYCIPDEPADRGGQSSASSRPGAPGKPAAQGAASSRGLKPAAREGLDPDFAYELVRWLSQRHGIRHVRLTGGEPLLYRALLPLIDKLARLDTLSEITLTTNGQALAQKADDLRAAGLARVNISLDTLDPDRFSHCTRGGKIAHTLAGIEAAVRVGLTPVKINVVAQRGLNDEAVPDLAAWGLARGCVVRFLEVMPIGPLAHTADKHLVSMSEILERLRSRFELRPIPQSLDQPAVDFAASAPGLRGVIGVIAATTRPFCARCRRLRITSSGQLIACVHDDKHFDLGPSWNGRRLDLDKADEMLLEAILGKPEIGPRNQAMTMLSIGG